MPCKTLTSPLEWKQHTRLEHKDAARIVFCVPAGLYFRYKKQNTVNLAPECQFEQFVVKIDVNLYEIA